MDVGLRQATPHPEVLPFSSRHACYQRPGRVHLVSISEKFDRFTGQPRMTNIPVSIERADGHAARDHPTVL